MIATNREFHAEIARAGRNPYYESLCLRLLDEGRRLLRMYYQSFDDQLPSEYVQEHEDLIAAIEARPRDSRHSGAQERRLDGVDAAARAALSGVDGPTIGAIAADIEDPGKDT